MTIHRAALVDGETAINVIRIDTDVEYQPDPGLVLVQVADDSPVSVGWSWIDNEWIPPPEHAANVLAHASYSAGGLSTASKTAVDVNASLVSTFTAPADGAVVVRLEAFTYNTANVSWYWSLRQGTTSVAGSERRVRTDLAGGQRITVNIEITGLTAGNSYTYKWAWRTPFGTAHILTSDPSSNEKYGPATMEVTSA